MSFVVSDFVLMMMQYLNYENMIDKHSILLQYCLSIHLLPDTHEGACMDQLVWTICMYSI